MTAAPAAGRWRAEQALSAMLPVAAWATYGPLGAKYGTWLVCVVLAAFTLRRRAAWHVVWQQPGTPVLLALWSLLALSALWSIAPWPRIGTHLWMYSLPWGAVLLAAACPAPAARRGLMHFVVASACVGALSALQSTGWIPNGWLWSSTVQSTGNQRIATSLLLALGAALGLWLMAAPNNAPRLRPHLRLLWLVAAGLALAGLVSQDRRTGMAMLPLLLLAGALAWPRRLAVKAALVVAVALSGLAVWTASDTVRARFAEGSAEVHAYSHSDSVASSWGQRMRMAERTVDLVRERPLVGHGLGSWQILWNRRVPPGTPLADNSTPHNEYLLVAVQAGVPATLLLLGWFGWMLMAAARARAAGLPALWLWLALAGGGLANAVLRDAKFALPLLLLAGLCTALLPSRSRPIA